MSIQLDQIAPDFEQVSTHGTSKFREWLGSSWRAFGRSGGQLTHSSCTTTR